MIALPSYAVRFERTRGAVVRGNLEDMVTPEAVRDHWDEITSFEDSVHPKSNEEDMGYIGEVILPCN